VRNRVLQALGVLRVREAGAALRQLYDANRHRDLGLRVLACLSRIGDPAQADLFRELVQDPDAETRRLAVEGLGRVADPAQLAAFKKDFQRERNDELKLAYAFSLTLLGDRAFLDTIVLALPSRTMGRRARSYLLELGRPLLPDLYPYLGDPDATIRAELCDILGTLGEPETIDRLTPLLNDPSPNVADRANRALERLRRTGSTSG
jgi:HEAT repeat protein